MFRSTQPAASAWRAGSRWLALAAGFAAAFVATGMAVLAALDAAGVGSVQTRLRVVVALDELLSPKRGATGGGVAYLGDSLSMDGTLPNTSVPRQLRRALANSERPIPGGMFRSVVASALTPFSFFFASERIADLRPDLVIMELNLWAFSRAWTRMDRPEMAGLLPASRWADAARLPLEAVGVSADRLVFYRSLIAGGALDAWHRLQGEQARVVKALQEVEQALPHAGPFAGGAEYAEQHRLATSAQREVKRPNGTRATADTVKQSLGDVLAGIPEDNPTLLAVGALLARFERAGIPVLVFVAPTNVEHLRSLGLLDARGLALTLERIESVVRRHGADFLDLHDRLEDAAFKDYLDHLHHDEGVTDGAARIVAELVPRSVALLSSRPAAR
jgi:hypothetical protein